jgi:hypothetical protein
LPANQWRWFDLLGLAHNLSHINTIFCCFATIPYCHKVRFVYYIIIIDFVVFKGKASSEW